MIKFYLVATGTIIHNQILSALIGICEKQK